MHIRSRTALLRTCFAILALVGCGDEPDGGTEPPPPDPPAPDISGDWIVVANTTFLGSAFFPGGLPEHCVADATVQITQTGSEFDGQFLNPSVFCNGAGPGFDGELTGLKLEGNAFLAQDEDCVYSGLITGDSPDMIEGTLDCTVFMQPQGPERVLGHWRFRRSAETPPRPNLTGDWVLVTQILNPDGVGCSVNGNYRFVHPEGERFSIEITNSVVFCNSILLPDGSFNGTLTGGTVDGTTMTIGNTACDYTGVVSGPPDLIDGELTCIRNAGILGPEVLTGPLRLRR